jgi:hypothetical protein
VSASYACLQTREGLVVVEPVSGRTLWTRSDVSAKCNLFGDDDYIYVVEMNAEGNPAGTRVLRAHDGVSVPMLDFAHVYQRKLRIDGHRILAADADNKGQVLRMYDIHTGRDVWRRTCAADAVVLKSESPNLAGVYEPKNGKVTVLDLATQNEVLQARVDPKHFDKTTQIHLLADRIQYYLVGNQAAAADNPGMRWAGPWPNLSAYSGMRAAMVNGHLYAFKKENGKLSWYSELANQALVLDQFQDLPILLFTSRTMDPNRGYPHTAVRSIDKRTGKLLFDQPNYLNGQQFHTLTMDARTGRIDFFTYNRKISHVLVSDVTGSASDRDATSQPSAPSGGQGRLDREQQQRAEREAAERALLEARIRPLEIQQLPKR